MILMRRSRVLKDRICATRPVRTLRVELLRLNDMSGIPEKGEQLKLVIPDIVEYESRRCVERGGVEASGHKKGLHESTNRSNLADC